MSSTIYCVGEYPIIRRPELMRVFGHNKARAELFNHMLYWIARKQQQGERTWFATAVELTRQLGGSWCERTLRDAALFFERAGLIGRSDNPAWKSDRTKYFSFDIEQAAAFFTLCHSADICPTCIDQPTPVRDMFLRTGVVLLEEGHTAAEAFCPGCTADLETLSTRSTSHVANLPGHVEKDAMPSGKTCHIHVEKDARAITKRTPREPTKTSLSSSSLTAEDDVSSPPDGGSETAARNEQQAALFPPDAATPPPLPASPAPSSRVPTPLPKCASRLVRDALDAIRGYPLEEQGAIIHQGKVIKQWCAQHTATELAVVLAHLKSGTCSHQQHQFWRQDGKLKAFFNADKLADITPSVLVELGQVAPVAPPAELATVLTRRMGAHIPQQRTGVYMPPARLTVTQAQGKVHPTP